MLIKEDMTDVLNKKNNLKIKYSSNSLVEPVSTSGGGGYNPLVTRVCGLFEPCHPEQSLRHPELDSGSIQFNEISIDRFRVAARNDKKAFSYNFRREECKPCLA